MRASRAILQCGVVGGGCAWVYSTKRELSVAVVGSGDDPRPWRGLWRLVGGFVVDSMGRRAVVEPITVWCRVHRDADAAWACRCVEELRLLLKWWRCLR